MSRAIINYFSASTFIFLSLIVVLSLVLVFFFLIRKFLPTLIDHKNNTYLGSALMVIGANYGLLLGFIIIDLWRDLDQVQLLVIQEADQLSLMRYNSFILPIDFQNKLSNGMEKYIHSLIYNEWPALREGRLSNITDLALQNLFRIIQSYEPSTKMEEFYYHQIVQHLNTVLENRSHRLEYIETSLMPSLRVILIMGLIVIVFLFSLLENNNVYVRTLSILLVSGILSFNVGLALLLDYPFSGSIVVSSQPYVKGILARFKPT